MNVAEVDTISLEEAEKLRVNDSKFFLHRHDGTWPEIYAASPNIPSNGFYDREDWLALRKKKFGEDFPNHNLTRTAI